MFFSILYFAKKGAPHHFSLFRTFDRHTTKHSNRILQVIDADIKNIMVLVDLDDTIAPSTTADTEDDSIELEEKFAAGDGDVAPPTNIIANTKEEENAALVVIAPVATAAATKKTQNDAQWVRELDPQSADPRLLKHQLQSDRQFKKHAWKRGDTVAPRTMCWEPAILARRSTAKIWDARIACDDGTKSVAEYLLRGEKVPPRRRRLTGAHADST